MLAADRSSEKLENLLARSGAKSLVEDIARFWTERSEYAAAREATQRRIALYCAIRGSETDTAKSFAGLVADTVTKLKASPTTAFFVSKPSNRTVYSELDHANQQRSFWNRQTLTLNEKENELEVKSPFGFETATMSMPRVVNLFDDSIQRLKNLHDASRPFVVSQ